MSTIHHPPAAGSAVTGLDELPPLTVVTDGIPASEHVRTLDRPLVVTGRAAQPAAGGLLYRLGILALLVLVLGSFGYGVRSLLEPAPTAARMGLSATEWSSYRAGEREDAASAATTPFAPFAAADPFAGAGP
jgi:hypothetical protein